MEKIVDTHVHIWDLDHLRLPWLDGEDYLNQTFTEEDYRAAVADEAFRMTDAIYTEVDCAADMRETENDWIFNQCETAESIFAGAIISGDLSDSSFKEYMVRYKTKAAGVRQVLHVPEREKGFCLQPQFIQNVRYLGELGVAFDLCMRNEELSDGYELVKQCPNTKVVLDHMGNPSMDMISRPITSDKQAYREAWFENLTQFSKLDNVYCKISGIMETEALKFSDFSEDINQVLDLFGEDRIVYASNFPVINLGGGLNNWTEFLLEMTTPRSEIFKRKLFSENARSVYLNKK